MAYCGRCLPDGGGLDAGTMTIDLAKARADFDAGMPSSEWTRLYGETLLTALEQMQAENEKYRKALDLIASHTRNVTGAPDMVRIALAALGNTPGDTV